MNLKPIDTGIKLAINIILWLFGDAFVNACIMFLISAVVSNIGNNDFGLDLFFIVIIVCINIFVIYQIIKDIQEYRSFLN